MAVNYYYYDDNNELQGPLTAYQIKALVKRGVIKPMTVITAGDKQCLASEIPGLDFPSSTASQMSDSTIPLSPLPTLSPLPSTSTNTNYQLSNTDLNTQGGGPYSQTPQASQTLQTSQTRSPGFSPNNPPNSNPFSNNNNNIPQDVNSYPQGNQDNSFFTNPNANLSQQTPFNNGQIVQNPSRKALYSCFKEYPCAYLYCIYIKIIQYSIVVLCLILVFTAIIVTYASTKNIITTIANGIVSFLIMAIIAAINFVLIGLSGDIISAIVRTEINTRSSR